MSSMLSHETTPLDYKLHENSYRLFILLTTIFSVARTVAGKYEVCIEHF